MRKILNTTLLIFALLSFVPTLFAAAPQTISYQGFVRDDTGVPLDGTYQVTFALYDGAGSSLPAQWSALLDVEFDQGVFHALLGNAPDTFGANLFGMPLWLGVTVHPNDGSPTPSGTELTPRQPLSSVPYALEAESAELLNGLSSADLDQGAHVLDLNNPHSVTPTQIGSMTRLEIETALGGKAAMLHHHDDLYYPKAQVDTLIQQLNDANAVLSGRIAAIEALDLANELQNLQAQITVLQNAGGTSNDLMQFVTVTGTDIVFSGANLYLNNGSGDQATANNLGNLVVGYNPPGSGSPSRSGSHNLILGEEQAYSATGAIISGSKNTVAAKNASVIAGYNAVITGAWGLALAGSNSEITGTGGVTIAGRNAKAYGTDSLSVGGDNGLASGKYAVRMGGVNNVAAGYASTGVGGFGNNISAPYALVAGGYTNAINSPSPNDPNGTQGRYSAILGGQNNVLNSNYALIAGGDGNNINNGATTTRGLATTIVGGKGNSASGNYALIAGGESNTVESSGVSAVVGRNSNVYGGSNNTASGRDAAIVGGDGNSVTVQNALALGGSGHTVNTTGGETLTRLQQLEDTFTGVSRNGDELIFTGLNIQLLNGLGQTDLANGLGNFTIGYNETRTTGSPPVNDRSGSHYLVLGWRNNYSSWGGVVHGYDNDSTAPLNAILGAQHADTGAEGASVFGGSDGDATALFSSVHGGRRALSSGDYATSVGGNENTVSGFLATGVGGEQNFASGDSVLVAGGSQNTASGSHSVVTGGLNNSAVGDSALVAGGSQNTASGSHSVVTGGSNNSAGRNLSSIRGGRNAQTSP